MKSNGGKMRLKILLVILGIVIIAFGIVFFLYGPYSEAAKGGTKGKPTPKPSSTTPTTSPSGVTTLFSDDFLGTLSKWQIIYTAANIISGELDLIPSSQTYNSPSDTHAPLIVAGDTAWKNYIFSVKMKTVKQLRPTNPNPWEVGWITFRMQDAGHSYYFVHKPNGIELGKYIPEQPYQYFLYTAEDPKLTIGAWNNYKIAVKEANIKIWINDVQVVDYTDPGGGTTGPEPWIAGKIGLYNEDAETLYDDVLVTSN